MSIAVLAGALLAFAVLAWARIRRGDPYREARRSARRLGPFR